VVDTFLSFARASNTEGFIWHHVEPYTSGLFGSLDLNRTEDQETGFDI